MPIQYESSVRDASRLPVTPQVKLRPDWSQVLGPTADLGPTFRGGQMLSGGAYLRAQNVSGGVCLFCGSRRQCLI